MQHVWVILAVLISLASSETRGEAMVQTIPGMIASAEAIAVISISGVKTASVAGERWTYEQVGSAKTENLLKGELPKEFLIYGSENFLCGKCPLANGRFLAFLKKDGDLWAGANWELSLRRIQGDSVEWYDPQDVLGKTKSVPLPMAVSEVRKSNG